MIHPEAAPGLLGGEWGTEVDLDLEMVSAVAPNAHLVLEADANVWNAITDAVDNNRGQIISMSFGAANHEFNPPTIATMRANLQQGNAQGITAVASSGDRARPAATLGLYHQRRAHQGIAVNLPAAYPEVTGVGGTEFVEGAVNYWARLRAPMAVRRCSTSLRSLGTIRRSISRHPKVGRDRRGRQHALLETGMADRTGVPNYNQRDVPDVALAASWDHDGYVIVAAAK